MARISNFIYKSVFLKRCQVHIYWWTACCLTCAVFLFTIINLLKWNEFKFLDSVHVFIGPTKTSIRTLSHFPWIHIHVFYQIPQLHIQIAQKQAWCCHTEYFPTVNLGEKLLTVVTSCLLYCCVICIIYCLQGSNLAGLPTMVPSYSLVVRPSSLSVPQLG